MNEDIIQEMRQKIDFLLKLVEKISEATDTHATAVENYSLSLDATMGTSVSKELQAIRKSTEQMMAENSKLQDKMDDSDRIIQYLKAELEQNKKESMYDFLTTCGNRRLFDKEVPVLVNEALSKGSPITFAVVDVDHFKSVNDTYGHDMGDNVLSLFGRLLTQNVRQRDLVIRWGGEEFVIICPDTTAEGALVMINKISDIFTSRNIVNRKTNQKLGKLTFSGGVHQLKIGETVEDAIKRADTALYSAKKNGRNQVQIN